MIPRNERRYDLRRDLDDAASDVSTESFNTGERVLLDGKIKAKVAYFGPVHFSFDDDWVGIVFEEPIGKHNGTADLNFYRKLLSDRAFEFKDNKTGLYKHSDDKL